METVHDHKGWGKYIVYFMGRLISSKTVRARSENHARSVARSKYPHRRVLYIVKEPKK